MKHRILAVAALLLLSLTTTAKADPPSWPSGLAYRGSTALCATKAGEGLFHQVFVQSCGTAANATQHWALYMLHEPDIYQIRNDRGGVKTGRCMEVQDKSTADGAGIRAEECDERKFHQMFRVNIHAGAPRAYVAVHSGKCLANNPSSIWVIQATCTGNTLWTPVGLRP
ncbi:RICIN domain-containing protein [Kibdelosporangium philippinense]|uniref:RICIN domain-containing protein n=1 Tax=Kibdelosporangium philippinense TaxID=211113 RepID=A0ABS8Z0R5_9PSEU|nr:RICIN domain-containing protein [Kibdelosporangium philippinense]MCE7001335.1 RICIN domain-containing protein [Kibdelosporangium philippinense]